MDMETLVKNAKSGDENAFCELIKINKEILYKTAYLYTKNKHDSLDILDETVYRAYVSIKKLKESRYFNTYKGITVTINQFAIDKNELIVGYTSKADKSYKWDDLNQEILEITDDSGRLLYDGRGFDEMQIFYTK